MSVLEDRRREDGQCARCGAQFHDDGRASDAGWITPSWAAEDPGVFLCPNCQTTDEDEAHTADLLANVEAGKRIADAEGEEYTPDLAALAARERERIGQQRHETEALNRLVGD